VLDEKLTETEAAMTRNGLLMFAGVTRVIPLRTVPSDSQAAAVLAKDDARRALAEAERERDECAARLEQVAQIVAGGEPDLRHTS
jgi:hypothetical protein